jgi:hypothetical protein
MVLLLLLLLLFLLRGRKDERELWMKTSYNPNFFSISSWSCKQEQSHRLDKNEISISEHLQAITFFLIFSYE